jgi:hypothetical protein
LTTHGLHDATVDHDQIDEWWNRWPQANIGLRTGIAFDVLDVDGPEGVASLLDLAPGYQHEGPLAATGKGWHLLFAITGGRNGANLRPKLDFRGVNGYIVAPPSIHPLGHAYAWKRPASLALPEAPAWLMDLLFPPKPAAVAVRPASSTLAQARDSLDLAAELGALGVELRQRGQRLTGRCPFHADDTPSLSVYPNQTFFCFGCQAWGDALNVRHFRDHGTLR